MRIDLHLHSLASKPNGDSVVWESNSDTAKKLFNAHIRMAAITDHNVFDPELYLDLVKKTHNTGLVFLPGIEVNVVRLNGEIGHLLVLFNSNLSSEQIYKLAKEIQIKIHKYGISIKEINQLFDQYETIRIPHVGKGDYFSYDDLLLMNYDAFEITNLEHKNYLDVKNKLVVSVVSFSDTHIWTNYPQQKKFITEINLPTPNFELLKTKLKEKQNYVKEL